MKTIKIFPIRQLNISVDCFFFMNGQCEHISPCNGCHSYTPIGK